MHTYCTFNCVYFLLLCTQLSTTYLDSFELRVRLKRWISVNGLLSHLDLIWKLRYRNLKNSQNANFLIWNHKGKYYIRCMDWISATKIHIYEYSKSRVIKHFVYEMLICFDAEKRSMDCMMTRISSGHILWIFILINTYYRILYVANIANVALESQYTVHCYCFATTMMCPGN